MMKKVIALVVLAAAMTLTAQAQGLKFGVKGGLNITKMSFNKDVFNSDNKVGFFVGPSLKLSLPLGFGVDIAALYDERSANVNSDGQRAIVMASYDERTSEAGAGTYGDETIKQKSLQIPLNLRYNIGLSSMAGLYLAAGPQFGFPVSDKVFKTEFGEYRLKDANLSTTSVQVFTSWAILRLASPIIWLQASRVSLKTGTMWIPTATPGKSLQLTISKSSIVNCSSISSCLCRSTARSPIPFRSSWRDR